MAAPETTLNPTITLDKKFTVDGQDVVLSFSSPDPAVMAAIGTNKPFPAGDVTLGSLSAGVSTNTPVKLGDANRNVTFSFTGNVSYGLQVLSDPAATLQALMPDKDIAPGIDLASGPAGARYLLLKLIYDVGLTAKGTVALAQGLTANFGATGSRSGDWAVVHRFGDEGAFDVLSDAFAGWILPRQLTSPSQWKPGTWLVTEVDGSIALQLGVQAGYDYSWIRKLAVGQLAGDLGVKVALAATASLGFSANGSYALALSRPDTSNTIRLALYKLTKAGLSFALNASAGVQGVLPQSLQNSQDPTDLIKAVFGVHATQLIDDLRIVQKVAAGGPLTDQAANYLVQLGQKELGSAAGDLVTNFNAGVDAANKFIGQLDTLGQRVTSQLFALLTSKDPNAAKDLQDLQTVLGDVQAAAGDPSKIATTIMGQLQRVAFFQTPFGKWITSAVEDGFNQSSVLSALKDSAALKIIGDLAGKTLDVLNGNALQTLVDFIKNKLNIQTLPTLANIDQWLATKLAAFLGKAVGQVVQQDLDKIQQVVNSLFNNASTFYTEAIKAAQKKYEATFVATYQSSTTDTALVDVVFDFDANPNVLSMLEAAIDGDFTQLLIDPSIAGVTLNSAVLTHGFNRQTHVELTLPFLDLGTTSATDVLSSVTVAHDGSGRVLAFQAKGTNDVVSFVKGRSLRDGQMTLALGVSVPQGVNAAPKFTASFSYSLRAANKDTRVSQLSATLKPLVGPYSLPLDGPGVDVWLADLDKITETVPTGRIGESLLSFDVAIPSDLPKLWFQAPAQPLDPAYFVLSKRIQAHLRSLIESVYFAQPQRYDNLVVADSLIAYASLRPMNSFAVNDDAVPQITNFSTGQSVYWGLDDDKFLRALLVEAVTVNGIRSRLAAAHLILSALGDSNAGFYQDTPGNLARVQNDALKKINPASILPDLLGSLLFSELTLVGAAVRAGTNLAAFVATAATDPAAAIQAMADFSDKIVTSFNQALSTQLFAGDELPMLGASLFTEVTRSLSESLSVTVPADAAPSALFSLSIPKSDAGLTPEDLVAGNYRPEQILVEQKLASPLALLAQASLLA